MRRSSRKKDQFFGIILLLIILTLMGYLLYPRLTGAPDHEKRTIQIGNHSIDFHLYRQDNSAMIFLVTFYEIPEELRKNRSGQSLIDEAVLLSVSEIQGAIKSQKETNIRGFPGRRIKYELTPVNGEHTSLTGYGMGLIKGNTVYVASAAKKIPDVPDRRLKSRLSSFNPGQYQK